MTMIWESVICIWIVFVWLVCGVCDVIGTQTCTSCGYLICIYMHIEALEKCMSLCMCVCVWTLANAYQISHIILNFIWSCFFFFFSSPSLHFGRICSINKPKPRRKSLKSNYWWTDSPVVAYEVQFWDLSVYSEFLEPWIKSHSLSLKKKKQRTKYVRCSVKVDFINICSFGVVLMTLAFCLKTKYFVLMDNLFFWSYIML